MAKKKKKYYVVWRGRKPGIYESWADCKAQIDGFDKAAYKSFPTYADASEAFTSSPGKALFYSKSKTKKTASKRPEKIIGLTVDAACSGNPGPVEYRGVLMPGEEEVFHQGPFEGGTNNLGEFLALVHALAMLSKKEKGENVPIYSDSKTAMAWVRNKKVKTSLKRTARNEPLFKMVDRALVWLSKNTVKNKILKWDTENWGEIPADFGRK